ncbi:ABC transporter permease [Leadbetterella byssophila]|uniref:ABC transporter permease n=1 Tax=Leadbetterella byssophila TaxID=316068 RepID=UPI0039A33D0C
MLQLITREFKRFFKDSTLVSVFFLAPIVYSLLIGNIYKKGKVEDLPVIVVDQDNTPLSNTLIEMIRDNEKLQVVEVKSNNTFTQEDLVKEKAVLAIVIPDRFEADILQKRYPEVNTYINTTNLLTANLATTAAQMSLGTFSAGVEMKANLKKDPSTGGQFEPFKANYIRLFNPGANYFTYMFPGMLMVVFQQVLLLGLAVSFSREFEQNTFKSELLNSTGSALKLMFVKVFPFWLLSIVLAGIFYSFHVIFKAPLPYDLWPFAINTGCFVVAVSMLGVLLSVVLKDSLRATQILMLIAAPAFVMGGYSWPLSAMPEGVQMIANAIPLTPFLEAHKSMLFQRAPMSDIMPQLKALGLQAGIYGVLAWAVLSFHIYRAKRQSKAD